MSNSRTPRAKRHGATQMPSKTFQTQNPGGCPACADRPLKTATRPDVLAVSILGSVFGVLGALLLAMPALPAWGFGAFLVSNLAWLVASARQRLWPLHLQQWVFLACSLLGLWNWWLGPLLLG